MTPRTTPRDQPDHDQDHAEDESGDQPDQDQDHAEDDDMGLVLVAHEAAEGSPARWGRCSGRPRRKGPAPGTAQSSRLSAMVLRSTSLVPS